MTYVPVETVRAGDELLLPRIGFHVVADVERDAKDRVWITYFRNGEETLERGRRQQNDRLVYRGLSPIRAGQHVTVRRGDPSRAAALRAELESAELERFALAEDRYSRAAAIRDR